jgi:hypothetical protein
MSEEFECFPAQPAPNLSCSQKQKGLTRYWYIHTLPNIPFTKRKGFKMMSTSSSQAQLNLSSEWDNENEMMHVEELFTAPYEEASKVFELWQTQTDNQEHELDIMEVDEQMGSNLQGDNIFHDTGMSPTGPLEELVITSEDVGPFSIALVSEDEAAGATSSLPFEEPYKATLDQLAELMERRQDEAVDTTSSLPVLIASHTYEIGIQTAQIVLDKRRHDERQDEAADTTSSLPFEEPYTASLDKLAELSQEIQEPYTAALDELAELTKRSQETQEPYTATLDKLAELTKRSEETRKGLAMNTPNTEEYAQTISDDQERELDIMEIDESNLLRNDIFHDPSMSPTGPFENHVIVCIDKEDVGRFSLNLLSDETSADTTSSVPDEDPYKATLAKLADFMKCSQETRKSLTVKTPKTIEYPRNTPVSGIITSIEKSTEELLQVHLNDMHRI